MDDHAQIVRASLAEVLPLLALARADDVQGLGLENILSNAQFFRLAGSDSQFAYALMALGRELWIQAAGGTGPDDLTALGFGAIERQASAGGFGSVGFQTRRRGLVRKAEKLGYVVDGWILRKKINV